jgi:hypothetical protein
MANTKDNAVIIFEGTDQLIEQTIAELKQSTITDEALAALKDQYSNMVIAGIEDMKGYKAVNAAVSTLRKIRTSVEARRKELTEPALKFQREVKAEADRISAEIKPLEEKLKEQVANIDDAREAARKAEYQRRLTLLTESGYQFINGFFVCGPVQFLSDQLVDLTDEQLEYHVNHGKSELARVAAEEQRKKDEAARLDAERIQIEAERAELAKMKAELEAQKKALETTYETVVQPEQPVAPIEFDMPKAEQVVAPAVMPPPPAATVDTEQQPPSAVPVWMPQNEFERGFNAFRVQLVALVGNPNTKLTRALLTDWAWNLPPTDTKK